MSLNTHFTIRIDEAPSSSINLPVSPPKRAENRTTLSEFAQELLSQALEQNKTHPNQRNPFFASVPCPQTKVASDKEQTLARFAQTLWSHAVAQSEAGKN